MGWNWNFHWTISLRLPNADDDEVVDLIFQHNDARTWFPFAMKRDGESVDQMVDVPLTFLTMHDLSNNRRACFVPSPLRRGPKLSDTLGRNCRRRVDWVLNCALVLSAHTLPGNAV